MNVQATLWDFDVWMHGWLLVYPNKCRGAIKCQELPVK